MKQQGVSPWTTAPRARGAPAAVAVGVRGGGGLGKRGGGRGCCVRRPGALGRGGGRRPQGKGRRAVPHRVFPSGRLGTDGAYVVPILQVGAISMRMCQFHLNHTG